MHASHSWSVCPHSIVQEERRTVLTWAVMMAVKTESSQALAMMELLLKAGADVNAIDCVSAWKGGWCGVPCVWGGW